MSENKNPTAEKDAALEGEHQQLITKNAEQDKIIAEQHEQIASLEEENIQLKAAIAKSNVGTKKAEKVKTPEKINVDGKNYKFALSEFHVPGHGKMTAAQLSQDKDALSAVLDIKGQTILKEIK